VIQVERRTNAGNRLPDSLRGASVGADPLAGLRIQPGQDAALPGRARPRIIMVGELRRQAEREERVEIGIGAAYAACAGFLMGLIIPLAFRFVLLSIAS
jgi:hypothetical protein